jgi:hypothetical protein
MNETPAEYIPEKDQNRPRYEQAIELGLALKGKEIPKLSPSRVDEDSWPFD